MHTIACSSSMRERSNFNVGVCVPGTSMIQYSCKIPWPMGETGDRCLVWSFYVFSRHGTNPWNASKIHGGALF